MVPNSCLNFEVIADCKLLSDFAWKVIPGSVAQKEGFWTKNKADALQAGRLRADMVC